MPNRVQPKTVV